MSGYVVINSGGLIVGTYHNYQIAQSVASENPGTRVMSVETYEQLAQQSQQPQPQPQPQAPSPYRMQKSRRQSKSIIPNMIGTYRPFRSPMFSPATPRYTLSERNPRYREDEHEESYEDE